jgi:hypothetical protein
MEQGVFSDISEIEVLVKKFLDKSLPKEEWTHAAHLSVGLYFVSKYGPAIAMERMRDCIFTYNEAVGTINSDTGGYHETITRFWVWLLGEYWERTKEKTKLVNVINGFLNSELSKKDIFFKFYSRELLFSKEARRNFVKPDLEPLDTGLLFN